MNNAPIKPLEISPRQFFKPIYAVLAALLLLFFLGLGFAADYTAKPDFCAGCHSMNAYVKSWRGQTHADVGCLVCHRDPGFGGTLRYRLRMVRYFSVDKLYFGRHRPILGTGAAGCSNCHTQKIRKTIRTNSGLRVSHKEITDSGIGCARCHADTAHLSHSSEVTRPTHEYCFGCHERERDNNKCSLCHAGDISSAGRSRLNDYRKANISTINDCGKCHSTAACRDCHESNPPLITY